MDKLIIEGGTPLKGTIDISGSKNAALPILFAGILLDAPLVYTNVPDLRDIHTTIKLLNVLGCTCGYSGHRVELAPGSLLPEAPYDLVRTMRASVLCLGPLLARIGQARVALPGGCAIGARPVDQHLKGLELMGATFELEEGYIMGHCDRLRGAHITFDMPTVGGTENLLMAAVLADGETTLENAAREPEVVDLANFLISCGARIEGHGSSTIRIRGVSSLRGTEYAIMADRIEAGTFLVAAGITGGELLLKNCPFTELESVIAKLESMGLAIEQRPEGVLARYQGVLRGADVKTRPYPGFPTDMQAQIMALMCLAEGSSMVEESIFENRFMHVLELVRMGADIRISGHTAMVRGVSPRTCAPAPRWCWPVWPPAARPTCSASTIWTAATNASRTNSTPWAPASGVKRNSAPAQGGSMRYFVPLLLLCCLTLSSGCGMLYGVYDDQRLGGTISDDKEISLGIKSDLMDANLSQGWGIKVYCYYGHVFLVGEAPEKMRSQAIRIARRHKGVRSVTSHWFTPAKSDTGDFVLATKLRTELIGTSGLSSTRIDTEVNAGRVVLLGVVKDEAERKLAIRAARQVEGVKQVISYLMLPQKQADMPVPRGQVVPGAGQGTQPAATPAAAPSTAPAAQPAAQNVPTMPPANSSHKLTPPTAPPPPPVGDEAAGAV